MIQAEEVLVVRILDRNFNPSGPLERIEYPAPFTFHFWLVGHRPERRYPTRFVIRDGKGSIVREDAEEIVPQLDRWPIYFRIAPTALHEPGEWTFEYYVDGVKIIDKRVPAVRVAQPKPAPPQTVDPARRPERVVLASAISRDLKPMRPLETLDVARGFYYFAELKGLVPGFNHQFRLTVLDGAGRIVLDNHWGRVPQAASEPLFYPVVPKSGHAPGTWTLRLWLDQQIAAETAIEARAAPVVARDKIVQHAVPGILGAMLLMAAYIGYHLVALRSGGFPAPAAGAGVRRGWLDPALLVLVAANLVPLGLVYFSGLNAADLLLIYWAENFVVAFYAVLRIACARGDATQPAAYAVLICLLMFTIVSVMHGGLLFNLVSAKSSLLILNPEMVHGRETAAGLEGSMPVAFGVPIELAIQVAVLMVSHGISFVHLYLRGGEYLAAKPDSEAERPMKRLAPMQVTAGVAGFFAAAHGSPLAMLIILVTVKTGFDAYGHVRAHAGNVK